MTLKRRLAKLEALINPQREPLPTVLQEPGEGATDEERAQFEQELSAARAAGGAVLVVVKKSATGRDGEGIRYVTAAHAAIIMLSLQPSTKGKASALDDLLSSLSGNVLGVSPSRAA